MRRFPRRCGGQGLVEFALILPVFLLIALGIMEFARAYWNMQVITNAAREGARVGILTTTTEADVTQKVNDYLASANMTATATVTVANVGAAAATGAPTTVTVTYPFAVLTGPFLSTFVPGWGGTINLSQTVTMRHE
ncbi:MAG: TadE/TadG family type IV pilus assembly protein [Nitrospinota bacterium]